MGLFSNVIAPCPKCGHVLVLCGDDAERAGQLPLWLCECRRCGKQFRVAVSIEISAGLAKRPAEYKPLRLAE